MAMVQFFSDWYKRYFSDPQTVLLVVLLFLGFTVIIVMGDMLAPVLAAVVIAYLLEGLVRQLERWGVGRTIAVSIVFTLFMAVVILVVMGLVPVVWQQLTQFIEDLPRMIKQTQELLLRLPEAYPTLFSPEQVTEMTSVFTNSITDFSASILSMSLATIAPILTFLVYAILGPLLVLFFLKDKTEITQYMSGLLPRDRKLLNAVWIEMDVQIGNYVRGKVEEIVVVGGVTYLGLALFEVNYAPLLAVLVGLSVIIPYIGAAVVTLPVALAAYVQFGWGADLAWIMVLYGIIQALDGNLLVPLLFSEAVNLHPVAIIVAVLVFGGIWGFWGVFFAIPLATLVKAILNSWPRTSDEGITAVPHSGQQKEHVASLP